MSAFTTNNSDTTTLAVPKLRDDGSNWADYEPRIQRALGSKGLWRHVEGTAIAPKPYALVAGVPVLAVMSLVIRHPPFSHFIAFLALLHRCLLSPTTTAPCDLVHDRCDLLHSHCDPMQPPRDLRLFVAALAPFGNLDWLHTNASHDHSCPCTYQAAPLYR